MDHELLNQRFPPGTTVKAIPAAKIVQAGQAPHGEPKAAATDEAVTAEDMTTLFEGLDPQTDYLAAAEVAGEWRYVRFRTSIEAEGSGIGEVTVRLSRIDQDSDWADGQRMMSYTTQNSTGRKQEILQGTEAAPDEGNEPIAVYSRVLKTPEASFSGDGAGNLAALRGHTTAVAGSQGQAIGIVGSAITFATYEAGHSLADGIGIYGVGVARGASTRTGVGGFFDGRVETSTGWATGIEVVADNQTGEDHSYTGTYPRTKSIHIHGTGKRIGVGAIFSNVGGGVHTGIAAITGAAITDTFIRDDSEAPFSIRIRGSHASAAAAIAAGAGGVVIGSETFTTAGTLLEVNGGNAKKDPLYHFRVTGENGMRGHLVANGSTQMSAFISDGANAFSTGSAKNDVGILFLAGKGFFLGPTGGTNAVIRAETAKLGFYGVAPVARHAAIALPAETLAAQKVFNEAVIATLKNVGLTE